LQHLFGCRLRSGQIAFAIQLHAARCPDIAGLVRLGRGSFPALGAKVAAEELAQDAL
jgi:hypothetical protein